jgi:rubrerythrin
MNNTKDNLQTAFAGESQANRKYLFFADKAEMVRRTFRFVWKVMRNG